jgi:hypothetical protein
MICIYIDIVLYRTFSQFSFLACIVSVIYVASETSGDSWSGGSDHFWGLGIPARHTPTSVSLCFIISAKNRLPRNMVEEL